MNTVIDCGLGNVASVANMLRTLGANPVIARRPEELAGTTRLILPGVGAYDTGMDTIERGGFRGALDRLIREDHVPTLGICLGMQLLARGSEEGQRSGLGYLPASFRRLPDQADGNALRVPHMGWNGVRVMRSHFLTDGLPSGSRFYFAHSYYAACDLEEDVLLTTTYGFEFPVAVGHGNITGVQFHPEKSHRFGMALLANFINCPER